jgi:hypothetical protein
MDLHLQEKAVETLLDWNRWVLGLAFAAGGGCIVVLERGIAGTGRTLVLAAIVAFALAIVLAAALSIMLAALIEVLPLRDQDGAIASVWSAPLWPGVTVGAIARLQFGLFALGLALLLGWVLLRG